MYEEMYAPLPDLGAYLKRIGLPDAHPEPTAEWLDKLVHAQLIHVPFDDMDCWGAGKTPSLDVCDLFEKIVVRRRGGYCFELNSLFSAFLRAVGFETYLVTIRLVGGRDYIPAPAHCAVISIIDGEKYFCDVGYGGQVPDGCVRCDGQEYHGYRIVPDGRFELTCLELVREDGSAEKIMLYHDVPIPPVDMIPLNFHVSQRPGSVFRSMLNVNLRLPDGSAWIKDRQFSLHTSTERLDRELRDLDDLREVLEKYFGIPANEPPLREFDAQP